MKGKKGFKFIAIPLFFVVIVTVLSFIVMHLWNFAVVKAANLNEIDFWQAAAMLVLSKILFGFGMGGGRKPWSGRRSWYKGERNLSEDQKELFRDKWEEHCRPKSKED